MPRLCSVCAHPQRVALEAAVLSGTSIRAAAKISQGISPFALRRHLRHVASVATQRADTEEKVAKANGSLRGRVEQISSDMRRIAAAAEKVGNFNAALAGLRAQLQCLEVLGKLSGELRAGINPGEFPGTAAVNVPAAAQKDTGRFVQLLRQIYGLDDDYIRNRAASADPIM